MLALTPKPLQIVVEGDMTTSGDCKRSVGSADTVDGCGSGTSNRFVGAGAIFGPSSGLNTGLTNGVVGVVVDVLVPVVGGGLDGPGSSSPLPVPSSGLVGTFVTVGSDIDGIGYSLQV